MGDVISFRRGCVHWLTSSGFTKASNGTSPSVTLLKRWAKPKLTALRPAKMLRMCESEHPAASASSLTVFPADIAQVCIGCAGCSDMAHVISDRNAFVKAKIFPQEMASEFKGLIKCDMGKVPKPEPREIHLGAWLRLKGIGPSKAAEIAGCTQGYISNISRGARENINALYLLRLSEKMEISVNDLFEPPPPASQVESLARLSDQARAGLFSRKRRKA